MNKITNVFFLTCCLFLATDILSQDRHFSQFYTAPLTINPALTGLMDGRYRAAISYRNQWSSILESPFVTTGISFDAGFKAPNRTRVPDLIGVGAYVFTDKVSQSEFATNQLMISGAFHKSLDVQGTHYLSGGYQIGLIQQSINYQHLTFGDQFDGLTGYTVTTAEQLPSNNVTFSDMAAGIFWTMKTNSRVTIYAGGSAHHFHRPVISFYKDEGLPDLKRSEVRWVGQLGWIIRTKNKLQLEPRAVVFRQGNHSEINAGLNTRITIDDYAGNYLFVGGWLRPVNDVKGDMHLDAAILSAALQLKNIQVGLSYDVNISSLSSVTSNRGGFELSLIFLGNYDNAEVICPTF